MTIDRRNKESLCHVSSLFDVAAYWQDLHDIFGGAPGLCVVAG